MMETMEPDLWQLPVEDLVREADQLNHRINGDRVTFVINRNANFTNVCNVGCTFCGFQRSSHADDAYTRSPQEVVERLQRTPWIDEVCMQGGIHPELGLSDYLALVRAIRAAFPRIHIHAFSPMEVLSLKEKSGLPYRDLLLRLREAGVDTLPGTAAEILVDEVREEVSRNKLTAGEWETIIRTAHACGLRTTATILFGHVETWDHIRRHFEILRRIQLDTGGFTELIPLAFIPYENRLGRRLASRPDGNTPDFSALERRLMERARRLYPLARLYFGELMPNLQTSWVKLGVPLAVESLGWGCNDFGGTLYEESITRESGGPHGEFLDPETMVDAIRQAGKTPIRRDTLYRPKHHLVPVTSGPLTVPA